MHSLAATARESFGKQVKLADRNGLKNRMKTLHLWLNIVLLRLKMDQPQLSVMCLLKKFQQEVWPSPLRRKEVPFQTIIISYTLSFLCSRASLVILITCKAVHWSEVRFSFHQFLMLFQEADQRPVLSKSGEMRRQNSPPTGAAKQVATPTVHAHTNRSWLWGPFWG